MVGPMRRVKIRLRHLRQVRAQHLAEAQPLKRIALRQTLLHLAFESAVMAKALLLLPHLLILLGPLVLEFFLQMTLFLDPRDSPEGWVKTAYGA